MGFWRNMIKSKPIWIRRDPSSDLLNSLEHCQLCLTLARNDERNWKWCVTAAHSAAQSAMVIFLEEDSQREREDSHRSSPRLKEFMKLYKACANRLAHINTQEHLDTLRTLNDLRNNWTHFGNYGLSVSIEVVFIAVRAGIKLIPELGLPFTGLYYSLTDEERHQAAMTSIEAELASYASDEAEDDA
jgi:hypothetical protein